MPDLDEVLEILNSASEYAKQRVNHIIYEEELGELPGRISESVTSFYYATVNAITAGGTLPSLPLPSLPEFASPKRSQAVLPPPPPPTLWARIEDRLSARPYLYGCIGGGSAVLLTFVATVHFSPAARHWVFGTMPFLKPVYLRATSSRRALPQTPRPRLSADGRTRLEAVIVLGCDAGSHGREVARAFEKKGFVVVASVSSVGQIDELERCGNGYIKAIALDTSNPASPSAFVRSLNTALSLRYPLHTAGDPFQNASSGTAGLQLSSLINCLPLSPSLASNPSPMEAIPSEEIQQVLTTILTIPLALLRSLLPILRASHDPHNAPCAVITCYSAPDRYLGTPFSGTAGALKGIVSNAAAQCLDVLRRELSTVQSGDRRTIKIVNVDVGFMQPVQTRRTHRGHNLDPSATGRRRNDSPAASASAAELENSLPQHLRAIYAPALVASAETAAAASARRHLPPVEALTHKLLKLVLKTNASSIPARTSVGAGVTTYYIASLLPISLVDKFFALRQRLLTSNLLRRGNVVPQEGAANMASSVQSDRSTKTRRPLPRTPVNGSSSRSGATSETSEVLYELPHESDTILPPYAPSAAETSSAHPSGPASSVGSPVEADPPRSGSGYGSGFESPASDDGHISRSTVLGESYVTI